MKLDIALHKGSKEKPAVVFIHGLGMNKDIWVNPLESRILGGQFPLKVLFGKMFSEEQAVPQTLYDDLKKDNYSVIAWSQKRPAGPIASVIPELDKIVQSAAEMTDVGIVLVGHSRGGLIGRKYLMDMKRTIKVLITIATPHGGSSIARIAKYVSPVVSTLDPLIPDGEKGTWLFSIKRIFDFLKGRALRELLPDSTFFKTLKDGPVKGTYYASIGGINPSLFTLCGLSFPDALQKIVPLIFYPAEMKNGSGDGLVTAESSVIPWGEEHHNFNRNHVEILFDESARNLLVRMIERICPVS